MAVGIERALGCLRNLPRVSLGNLRPLPGTRKTHKRKKGKHGRGNKGQGQRNTLPRIGFEGNNTPFYLQIPKEPYYTGHSVRRQYPPLSLLQLQRLIDLGRIDPSEPIDLTTICNTKVSKINTRMNHYGFNLTEEGADLFQAQVNIEVQFTSELAIAAVEKNGGTITTKFYDLTCVRALADPMEFFVKGYPIPRCKLPPENAVEYYSDARNRGYLADPELIRQARLELAQKYGYFLPDLSQDPNFDMLMRRKDPRQIWFGLAPGWLVNMRDRTILKPTDEQLQEYYRS